MGGNAVIPEIKYTKRLNKVKITLGIYHIFNPKRKTIEITIKAETSISSQKVTSGAAPGRAYKWAAASSMAKNTTVNLTIFMGVYPPVKLYNILLLYSDIYSNLLCGIKT